MAADHRTLDYDEFLRRSSGQGGVAERMAGAKDRDKDKDGEHELAEGSCPAFGFLRGLTAQALHVEFRFRTGDSDWYAYNQLSSWRHRPGTGLLLKFTGGDVVTMVLIRASNVDAVVHPHGINLTDRGFQRNRILWVREMDEDELRAVGNTGPTIDRIEVEEFESNAEVIAWLKKVAPAFLRQVNSGPRVP